MHMQSGVELTELIALGFQERGKACDPWCEGSFVSIIICRLFWRGIVARPTHQRPLSLSLFLSQGFSFFSDCCTAYPAAVVKRHKLIVVLL